VGQALFGADLDSLSVTFNRHFRSAASHVTHMINSIVKVPLWFPSPRNRRFLADRGYLFRVAANLIGERRQRSERGSDLLQLMMDARDEDGTSQMSDPELLDQVMTMLVAGHETVSATMSWAFHLLDGHPEKRIRMEEELDRVTGGAPLSLAHLSGLKYTRAVVLETLRLYPPVWAMSRDLIATEKLGSFELKKGGMVLMPAYLTHRHPDFWDKPEEFQPERFVGLNGHPEHPFAFYPFAAGPRMCLGNEFALTEGTLILAAFGQSLRLIHAEPEPVEIDATFTLRPRRLLMRAESRPGARSSTNGL